MPKWFQITALAGAAVASADITLRGYIGESKTYRDYWTGEEELSGGAGTVQEFEAELNAVGNVQVLNVFITSQGGDYMSAIAIHNILARQKARVVCTIDGFAFSAAPVIAMAADEVRSAGNALLMIHDAEFWSAGSDIKALQDAIKTLQACNDSMATAFRGKANGTMEEWHARMEETTWLTGAQAKELGLVDTLLDDVALTAFAPLQKITASLPRVPEEIRALFDKVAVSASKDSTRNSTPTPMLRPRTPLFSAATETGAAPANAPAPAAAPAAAAEGTPTPTPTATFSTTPPPETTPVADVTAAVTGAVTAAVKPLMDKVTALEGELAHLKGVQAHGIGNATAAAGAPVASTPSPAAAAAVDVKAMSPLQLISHARTNKG